MKEFAEEISFGPMKNKRGMWKYSTHRDSKFCALINKLNITLEKGVGIKWDIVHSDIVHKINSAYIHPKWKVQLKHYIHYVVFQLNRSFFVDPNGVLQKKG